MQRHTGEIGPSDAEGATAPETLRQKDRVTVKHLESDAPVPPPPRAHPPKG